jgi:hypothetical protein
MSGAPLERLLGIETLSIEALLLGLATDLGSASIWPSRSRIDELAARLDGIGRDPAEQLHALGKRVAGSFTHAKDSLRRADFDDLRPEKVLLSGAGDDMLIAAIVAAAGQRHGWSVSVVSGSRPFVAHRGLSHPLLVCPQAHGRLLDGHRLGETGLRWRCAHEVAGCLLDRLDARGERLGQRALVARARELAMALPLAHPELAARELELARARASWN